MPGNAILLLDQEAGTYFAPPFVENEGWPLSRFRMVTSDELKNSGFSPDPKCRDKGYFMGYMAPAVVFYIGESLGKNPRRWNEDGTWNW